MTPNRGDGDHALTACGGRPPTPPKQRRSDLEEAEALLRHEVRARAKVSGAGSALCLRATGRLGELLAATDALAEAEECLQTAWTGQELLFGWKHRVPLESLRRLAEVQRRRGRLESARESAVRCLEGACERGSSSAVEGVLPLLEGVLRELGRDEEADGVTAKYLERVLGLFDLRTLDAMRVLAARPWQDNHVHRNSGAVKLLRRMLVGYQRCLGDGHASTRAARQELARRLAARSRATGSRDAVVEAERELREEVQSRTATYGTTHERTLDAVRRYGLLLWRRGTTPEKAVPFLQRVVDGRERRLGHSDPLTLAAVFELCELHRALKQGDDGSGGGSDDGGGGPAEGLARRALEGYWTAREVAGGRGADPGLDAAVERSAAQLTGVLRERGELEEARRVAEWYRSV